jgi:hypothetical protein
MNYTVICKNSEEICEKLKDKYIKIELLDETSQEFGGDKMKRLVFICEYIIGAYSFSYKTTDLTQINIDKLTYSYSHYISGKYYDICNNIIYLHILPESKYKWFEEKIKLLEKYSDDITDITLEVSAKYNETDVIEYNKKRFGEYKVSFCDNINQNN